MNISWHISQSEAGKFLNSCEAVIRNIDSSTKSATELACAEILAASIEQVPKDTGALASTGDYLVRRRADVKGYRYEGVVGYAGAVGHGINATTHLSNKTIVMGRGKSAKFATFKAPASNVSRLGNAMYTRSRGSVGSTFSGILHDAINPKSGLPVSAYAAVVHEDLDMPHPRGGKAKFLEDPVREYGQARFKRVAEEHWRMAISWADTTVRNKYGREVPGRIAVYSRVRLSAAQARPHGPRGSGPVV